MPPLIFACVSPRHKFTFSTPGAMINSLAKDVMSLVALVCLYVCLWTTLLKRLLTDLDEILWRSPG